ncbi:MAG: tetratricopeptide repeat protein [bacterium]|nr:tetratricopeptide repeat protein [bacterium]
MPNKSPKNPKTPPTKPHLRPFDIVLMATVVLVPLIYEENWVFVAFYTKLLVFQIGLCALYATWVLNRQSIGAFRTSPIFLPLGLYISLSTLSIFWAINPVEALVHIAQHVGLLLFFLVLFNNLTPQDLPRHLPPIVITATLVAFTGILQFAGWGMHGIPSAGLPSGTMGYRNYAAMYMILSLPLGVFLFLQARRISQIGLWGFCISLMFIFLICTRTRGAWLGLATACVIAGLVGLIYKRHSLIDPKQPRPHILIALAGLILTVLFVALVPPNMGARGIERQSPAKADLIQAITSPTTTSSIQNRLDLSRHTLEMIADAPLLGVGMGNWQFTYPIYDGGDTVWKGSAPRRPHNDYLWAAAELGLPGLALFLWFLTQVMLQTLRLFKSVNTASQRLFALCLGISLLALMGHAFFSFPRERIAPSMLFWMLVAFVAILDHSHRPTFTRLPLCTWIPRLGLICLLLATWFAARSTLFDRHFAFALGYLQPQAWDRVIQETTLALQKGVFDPQAFLIRGVAHFQKNNYNEAVQDNLKCLNYHPNLVNALNNLGMAYNELGQHQKAIAVLQRIPSIDRDHVESHANLGLAYQGLKQYDPSIAAYKQALARNSDSPDEIRYHLATTYEQQGNMQQASTLYAQILKNNPNDARTLYRSGVIFQRLQQYDRAIRTFQKTLQFLPNYPPAYYNLGEVYLLQADTTRALSAFEAFLSNWQGNPQPVQVVRQKIETLRKKSGP